MCFAFCIYYFYPWRARQKQLSVVFGEAMSHVASEASRVYEAKARDTKVDGEQLDSPLTVQLQFVIVYLYLYLLMYGKSKYHFAFTISTRGTAG